VPATPIYHVGILVHDIDAAAERFGELLGIEFVDPASFPLVGRTPNGLLTSQVTLAFSIGGPPFIELIKTEDDGGPFDKSRGEGLHHIGAWTDDVDARLAHFASLGAPTEIAIAGTDDGNGPALVAFAQAETVHGVRIELIRYTPEIPGYTPEFPGTHN
jgi:catechol 2,3-dioxygenase-like lactoylglutathione lyase family enzyme